MVWGDEVNGMEGGSEEVVESHWRSVRLVESVGGNHL
jgi:hypothetical protein